MDNISSDIQEDGFSIINRFFTNQETDEIIFELNKHRAFQYHELTASNYNLIKSIPFIKTLTESNRLLSTAKNVIGKDALPVNAFIIDKTKINNWELDWHQDLRIAISNEMTFTGYSDRTVEHNITHAIAPQEVLEKRLSIRIHLDDCTINNGAMLVVPQSHKKGIIGTNDEIGKLISSRAVCCEVEKGGVMFFKSLLFHKSPYSLSDKKRRVLHIDYIGAKLTNYPEWYNA